MPANSASLLVAPARAPRDIDIAFYTLGDNRDIVEGPGVIEHSKAWRLRANTLATSSSHVHGVTTVEDAIAVLQAMPAKQHISRAFFIGHGFEGGYFFSGDPVGDHDFEAPPEHTLEDPSPAFLMNAGEHVPSLDSETISPGLVSEFGAQAVDLDRPNASISRIAPGRKWRVTGVVGGPMDLEDFLVVRAGLLLQVFTQPAFEGRERTLKFLKELIKHLSKTGHVEVNFLSCFTGAPDSQHRLDILTAAELQRNGFEDFSVGAYIHFYQVVVERRSVKVKNKTKKVHRFFDYINIPSNGAIIVQNPGENQIPPFERLSGGRSISTG